MGEMDSYKESCEYIQKEFKMEGASLYAMVSRITEAYKDFKDREEVEKLKKEELALAKESQPKEKKNVRRKKRTSSN